MLQIRQEFSLSGEKRNEIKKMKRNIFQPSFVAVLLSFQLAVAPLNPSFLSTFEPRKLRQNFPATHRNFSHIVLTTVKMGWIYVYTYLISLLVLIDAQVITRNLTIGIPLTKTGM